jgi:hypothetical protein
MKSCRVAALTLNPVSSRLIRMLELLIYRADTRPRNGTCRKVSGMEGAAVRGSHIFRDQAFSVSRYIGLQDCLQFTGPSSTTRSQPLEGE